MSTTSILGDFLSLGLSKVMLISPGLSLFGTRVNPLETQNIGMPDDKRGRDKQADDEDRRQRERAMETYLARRDEAEPPLDDTFKSTLEPVEFPATGADVVAEVGDHEVDLEPGTYHLDDLVPEVATETFESPARLHGQVKRPTVATAMKRILEAAADLQGVEFGTSQRDAYERTFLELVDIDPVDEDQGVPTIADWIVSRMHESGSLPGSRSVRREAANYCRSNGYEVRSDEWLGV